MKIKIRSFLSPLFSLEDEEGDVLKDLAPEGSRFFALAALSTGEIKEVFFDTIEDFYEEERRIAYG